MAEYTERDATCKNCLHYDVCYHIEHYGRHMETDEPCVCFINKSDVVAVVRCKDCKHYVECNSSLVGIVSVCTNQGSMNVLKSPSDYCSIGERKDDT